MDKAAAIGQYAKESNPNSVDWGVPKAAEVAEYLRNSVKCDLDTEIELKKEAIEEAVEIMKKVEDETKERAEETDDLNFLPLVHEVVIIKFVEPSKGLFERIGEKLHDTKEFIEDKVEHLGSAIKDVVIGAKEETEDEIVEKKERMRRASQHIKEGLSGAFADLTGTIEHERSETSKKQ
jgi:hypothetical protein